MKEDPMPESNSSPASEIGEHLHCDLIPCKKETLGGNRWILFTVCEKTGYVCCHTLKTKETEAVSK